MSANWGRQLRLTLFGESHGPAIGIVIDGLPAGLSLDWTAIRRDMARRAPGQSRMTTSRKEADEVHILSGLYEDKTTGAPLCAQIVNTNTRSQDYANLARVPRPGHADFTGAVRYGGYNDPRGGGPFSGRLTAPLVFAGAVARGYLGSKGIQAAAAIDRIGRVADGLPEKPDFDRLRQLAERPLAVYHEAVQPAMQREILEAREALDSVGGSITCYAWGLPVGLGEPFFGGVESVLAGLLYAIPAVKGVEFGDGFGLSSQRGSVTNDAYEVEDGRVVAATNHHGGALGGITSGMPLRVRVGIKPTPSISQPQRSVNLDTLETVPLVIEGRHDPCIVTRAVPVVEACVLLGLMDLYLEAQTR